MPRPDSFANRAGRRKATRLLAGCALAPVLAALPQVAAAQAFSGTPTVVSGFPTFNDGPGVSTIGLKGTETVINWTPFDTAGSGTIDFLPKDNFALFTGPAGFTVLNRVLPVDGSGNPSARAIGLNGTMQSTVGRQIGGNVWFYSPTGIIVGPTATITVGGLVLTTNDIVFDPANTGGTELYGPNNTVLFRGPAGSKGLVDVQASNPGAGITAASYVALVAPRVQQAGMISANGPIGYVGAEQADISINAGLFDISILAGTTDPNGVVHTGTTTGPASTGGTDQQQIMMVAMPKSTALTMLLSGSIGYAPAVSAFDDGSSVILSAGYDRPVPTNESAGSLGHIAIDNASFLNPVSGYSTGTIDITGAASFGSNAYLFAQDAIDITLTGSESFMSVADFLSLNAARKGQGGKIDIKVGPAAKMTVGSYLNLNASANSVPYDAPDPVNATGGTVTIDVDDAELAAVGGISADVTAFAGFDPVLGGTARAGSASFTAHDGGMISASSLGVNADASGGGSDDTAGDAFGGTASLTSHGGVLDLGSIYFEADAFGGEGGLVSGAATGGKASILLDGGSYDWNDISAYTDARAGYNDGSQGNGATGRSEAISLTLSNGAALTVAGNIDLTANAFGTYDAPAGSSVHGGGIALAVNGGSSLAFANLTANAQASIEAPFFSDTVPSRTPDATGGTISLTADGGAVTGQSLSLLAEASELAATDSAGTAHGGMVDVDVLNGGSLTLFSGEGGGGFTISANGYGAVGQSAANAIGGTATLKVTGGTVDVNGLISLTAGAFANNIALFSPAGSDPVGFDATGGTASVQLLPGASLTATDLFVDATGDASTPEFFFNGGEFTESGFYGGPFPADGGTGTGGTATLSVGGGNLLLTSATVSAEGYGGLSAEASSSGTPFRSGDGRGGTAGVTISGGSSAVADLYVSAAGFGGDGSSTGPGDTVPSLAGDGYGGTASLTITGGTLQADTLTLDATGTGGVGGDGPDDTSLTPATDGGKGTGGTARLVSTAGSTGQLTAPTIAITAIGTGGAGGMAALGPNGNGGDGIGGTTLAQLADGAFDLGPLNLQADGYGGDGVVGGVGSGGSAQFILDDSATGPSGPRTIDGLQLSASGSGGSGADGIAQSDAGSALLTLAAKTGSPLIIDGDLGVSVEGARSAAGDGLTASFSGEPVQVTGNTAIFTTRDVTITSTSPLQTAGDLSIIARKLSGPGQLIAGGSATINADQGIALDKLSAGTTTSLQAANGAILVATDLASGGDVSATGRSIDITSLEALNFATAQATAGDLAIATQGNLTMTGAAATGNVDLSSAAGSFSTPGTIAGGGNVSISGRDGVAVPTVVSGGTTHLAASNGAVSVASLTSPGAVTASGHSVDITSPGALTFTSADATAGSLRIATASNLVLTDGSASGTVNLTSSGGSITSGGVISSGSAFTAHGATDLDFTSILSGGSTVLDSSDGALLVAADLESSGAVTATGRSIDIGSSTGLLFANAQATAGDLNVSAGGNLSFAQASASGAIGLSALTGYLNATGPVTAGGDVSLAAIDGLDLGTVTSGGTTYLDGGMSAVRVTDLLSAGLVTAVGVSLDIASSGALTFSSFDGGPSTVRIATVGDLVIGSGTATGDVDLSSSAGAVRSTAAISSDGNASLSGDRGVAVHGLAAGGAVGLTAAHGAISVADLSTPGAVTATARSIDLSSSGQLTLASASATAGDLTLGAIRLSATGLLSASGNVAIDAANGISVGSLSAGGTTKLTTGGAILATDLQSGGHVSATGLSIDITSSGALTFDDAQATAGALRVHTAGDLAFNGASATGAADLASSAGVVTSSGAVIARSLSISGRNGIAFGTLSSGGTTSLTSSNGTITITDLSSAGAVTAVGRIVTLNGGGALSFANARATAGDLNVTTAGNLSFAQASASGAIGFTSSSGSLTATGTVTAGGAVNLFGATGLTLGSLTSGGTTLINGGTGALTVTSLTSPGAVTALGRSLAITSPGALTFTSIAANGGAAQISTDGNLAIGDGTVTGALTMASANGAISSAGTVTAGGAVDLNGKTGLDFNRLNSGGTTSLVSAGGPIHIVRLESAGLITADAHGPIDIGSTEGLSFDSVKSLNTTTITAAGDLAFNTIDSGLNLTLSSTGGGITVTGDVHGGFTRLSSLEDITLGGALNVAGSLSVDSRGALVVVGDTYTDDAGISADGGITMAGLRTGESTGLRAVNGNIRIANLDAGGTITAGGLDIDIASTGSLNFLDAQATQDNLAIRTGGDLTAQRLLANHDITLTAGGTFALSGEARGVNIAVTSRDIDLGGEASLGVRGTTSEIALFDGHPSQETFIGGAASESGYSLDADEALHLFADKGIKLGVAADELASDEGHVTVGDLHLAFGADSGNIGSGGYLEITSPTEISILGNVALTTGSEDDRFIIDPTRVELNTETGSIALLDGSGNPLGRLDVTGDTVAVGTGSTLDQLRGLTDMAAINALLGTAGGKSDPLRAGSMIFRVADGLFIQNSGASTASADRRGFTTNALDIFTGSPATKISINGVILQSGTPVTGLDTAPLVTINEVKAAAGGQFDPLSTINGCGIGLDCAPPPPPDTPDDEFTPPPNDDITPPVTPVQPGGGLSGTLVQLEDNQPLITPPLVDEPITGVGNDDLWVAQCTDPQQEGCPQQDTAK